MWHVTAFQSFVWIKASGTSTNNLSTLGFNQKTRIDRYTIPAKLKKELGLVVLVLHKIFLIFFCPVT